MNRRSGPDRYFEDRREAGRALAAELATYRGATDLLVLGLARGGVPVGWEVARALCAPLDAFLVRKLGAPGHPELAMGALASGGGVVMNDDVVAGLRVTDAQLRAVIAQETAELHRREQDYGCGQADPAGKTVILVDDGIATGASMAVAVQALRDAARIVVAVPVGPHDVCRRLGRRANEVVCVTTPAWFHAVGQVYRDFRQVSDEQVRALLR